MPPTPAANAVKHGLSSFHHMPRGREHELPPIVQALIESRRPDSPQELEIVHELAFAMWQKGEHDRLILEEAEKLSAKAGELFDKQARETFEKLKADWQKDPVTHQPAMAETQEGAGLFASIWESIETSIEEESIVGLKTTLQAIRAEGGSSSPQSIQGEGRWIMLRFLSIKSKPSDYVDQWLAEEGLNENYDAKARAKHLLKNTLEADPSCQELYDKACDRHQKWAELQQKHMEARAIERQAFIEQYQARVMLADEFDAQMKRLHRYRVFTENRVKDANRRLENLKAAAERKAQRAEDREFRKVNQMIAISKLSGPEYERFQNLQGLARMEQEMESGIVNDRPEPVQEIFEEPAIPEPVVEVAKVEVLKVPRDWRSETAILPQVVPNMAVFSDWTDEEMDDSTDFIAHIAALPEKDTQWKQCLLACQIMEMSRRHLARQQKKKA